MAVRALGVAAGIEPRIDGRVDAAVIHHVAREAPGQAVIVVQGAAKSEGDAHQGRKSRSHHSAGSGSLAKAELRLSLSVLASVLPAAS